VLISRSPVVETKRRLEGVLVFEAEQFPAEAAAIPAIRRVHEHAAAGQQPCLFEERRAVHESQEFDLPVG
jgi:hypothetical protein